jgi:hypothetical protein
VRLFPTLAAQALRLSAVNKGAGARRQREVMAAPGATAGPVSDALSNSAEDHRHGPPAQMTVADVAACSR